MSAFAESLSTAVGLVRDADPQLTRIVLLSLSVNGAA